MKGVAYCGEDEETLMKMKYFKQQSNGVIHYYSKFPAVHTLQWKMCEWKNDDPQCEVTDFEIIHIVNGER